jgi:hypothetical protein
MVQVILGILAVIVMAMLSICVLRMIRAKHSEPKFIPTQYLRRLWVQWNPRPPGAVYHRPDDFDDISTEADSVRRPSRVRIGSTACERGGGGGGVGAELQPQLNGATAANGRVPDRQTSVRSIMTLPPYRVDPINTEQVIGREGERDGVDVVVELPTEEELEAWRDDEMEALYQIRLARRQENAERERRREERRDARNRGDFVALDQIRQRTREASNNTVIDDLRQNHERLRDQRNRTVSSVSYGNIGVARHDGSRIRANSSESERIGLLSDAASIGALSTTTSGATSSHQRNRSSSVLSGEIDMQAPSMRSRASSRAETIRLSTGHSRSGSTEILEADLGEAEMPPPSPPGYDQVELHDRSRATSRATTPQNEPPPDYPGPTASPHLRSGNEESYDMGRRSSGRDVDAASQLPSLQIRELPQIVIDSSGDGSVRRG